MKDHTWGIEDLDLPPITGISREEMQTIESIAYLKGVKPKELMNRAGEQVATYINENYSASKFATILVSAGNNGGDGLVTARYLQSTFNITVVQLSTSPMKSNEGQQALHDIEEIAVQKEITLFQIVPSEENVPEFSQLLQEAHRNPEFWQPLSLLQLSNLLEKSDVIIDAIFGMKVRTKIREPYTQYLELLAQLAPPFTQYKEETETDYAPVKSIIALDIPSGLDANTKHWLGPAYGPEVVLTMQFSKTALDRLKLPTVCLDIGINTPDVNFTSKAHFIHFWYKRDLNSHKGVNGRLMVVGGSDEYTGAPVLASRAALRLGVDTVRTFVPESIRDIVASYSENFLVVKVNGKHHTDKNLKYLVDMAVRRHTSVAMGMGLSNNDAGLKLVREFVKRAHKSVSIVIDADAIRAFRGHINILKNSRVILTPHKAELRYLCNEEIPRDFPSLVNYVQQKAKELNVIFVLKGRVDIITNGYRTLLNATGHPGMTVGGTGDVLAGVIAASTCFVRNNFFAAALGTYIMGMAGEAAAKDYGNGLLATDIITKLPKVLLELEQSRTD